MLTKVRYVDQARHCVDSRGEILDGPRICRVPLIGGNDRSSPWVMLQPNDIDPEMGVMLCTRGGAIPLAPRSCINIMVRPDTGVYNLAVLSSVPRL
jgi:hypothetical protein